MFTLMPLIGISQGLQAIIGFNYGAQLYERVKQALKIAIIAATSISFSAAIILFFFFAQIALIFTHDQALIAMGSHAIIFITPTLTLLGFQVINNNMFEAFGKAKAAFFISMLREVIFLIPMLLILPLFLHLNGIWLSFPVTDILAFSVTLIMFIKQMRKLTTTEVTNK